MAGSRIRQAKEALQLFIRSLPPDSKFNIVSFGSDYKLMFQESVEFNNENLEIALEQVSTFSSDLGGTELFPPIEAVLTHEHNHQYPTNVFILTDGAVSNTESVLSKIEEFNHIVRVHSFGIGSGADRYEVIFNTNLQF